MSGQSASDDFLPPNQHVYWLLEHSSLTAAVVVPVAAAVAVAAQVPAVGGRAGGGTWAVTSEQV